MTDRSGVTHLPPDWALQQDKPIWQRCYDFLGSPLRMLILPDRQSEQLHLTSLRGERFAQVLPELKGRVLDVGAGDNTLLRLYRSKAKDLGVEQEAAMASVGVDVVDWGGSCTLIESSARIPYPDASFDTIVYVACLNHIPERAEALLEALRLLRPNGRVVITMIGRIVGKIGHALWWYSEDKHRQVDAHEEMGLDPAEVLKLFEQAGFRLARDRRFGYGLNRLYVFEAHPPRPA